MITVAFMSHIQRLADTGGEWRSGFWPKALLKCFMTFMTKLKCIFPLIHHDMRYSKEAGNCTSKRLIFCGCQCLRIYK